MTIDLASLRARLHLCLGCDRRRLRRALDVARRYRHNPSRLLPLLARLATQIQSSIDLRAARLASRPTLTFPPELPVSHRRDDIARAIAGNQVLVLCGETGSGKSTQLPKICLDLGRGLDALIAHTQPRRIAARALASRLAYELDSPLGELVGYKVRFDQSLKPSAFVKLMTDGILLAELQSDPLLLAYDTIIIDEAHERSVNIDFLLGCLHRILPRRPDLKLIITSATIDPQRFSRHFGNCPIIDVSGRTFPVEIRYRPIDDASATDDLSSLQSSIVSAVRELLAAAPPPSPISTVPPPSDILVFLPGEREIRDTARALRTFASSGLDILPLYARLSATEQQRVFQPHARTRIILATNVAETSLTVPGVRYVIDAGLARISRYNSKTKFLRLPIQPISQAASNQRAGRCGRTADGICIRLFSEDDFNARDPFTQPEIQRTNLAAVILQMLASNLGDISSFPFIDRPRTAHVRDAFETLHELNAIDAHHQLTPLGRQLAQLPVDPRLGRMIITAQAEGSLRQVLILAAALSIQDPRDRPLTAAESADAAHRAFRDPSSDLLTLLNLWHAFSVQSRALSQNQLRRWCAQRFLNWNRMNEWRDLHHQLLALMLELRVRIPPAPPESDTHPAPLPTPLQDAIHRAVLSGLLSNIALKDEGHAYLGANRTQCFIFPGSALFNQSPRWVMAAELVETSRLYLRNLAPIKPEWAEEFAPHLVTRSCVEPHWDPHSARIMAYERVTLFGLDLISRRRVHYGPINPALSRELFIHHALVNGDYRSGAQFLQHNRRLVEEIQILEDRTRRHDLLIDPQQRFIFYDALLPPDIYTGRHFEKWASRLSPEQVARLHMSREMILKPDRPSSDPAAFPDVLPLTSLAPSTPHATDKSLSPLPSGQCAPSLARAGDGTHADNAPDQSSAVIAPSLALPLSYRHAPGEPDDGVSVSLPFELLPLLSPARLDHLVPGLLREKITTLLRGLPKDLRQQIAPLSEFVDSILATPPPADLPLTSFLTGQLRSRLGLLVTQQDWNTVQLPPHLLMNIRLLDAHAKLVAQSRSLSHLRAIAAQHAAAAPPITDARFPVRTTSRWNFGDLPDPFPIIRANIPILVHPAIIDSTDSIQLSLAFTASRAASLNHAGVRRLFALHAADEIDSCIHDLPDFDRICLDYSTLGSARLLQDHLRLLIAEHAFIAPDRPLPRTQSAFESTLHDRWSRLWPTAGEVVRFVAPLLRSFQQISLALSQASFSSPSITDLRDHLVRLVPPDFLISTPEPWLTHLPRYLAALTARLNRLFPSIAPRPAQLHLTAPPSALPLASLKPVPQPSAPQRATKEFAKDHRVLAELLPLQTAILDRFKAITPDLPDPALINLRWLLEELRVALFAQELSTIQPVSIKRLQRALDLLPLPDPSQ